MSDLRRFAQRREVLLLVPVAVVVLVLAALALRPGSVDAVSSLPSNTPTAKRIIFPIVAFFGDSYVEGTGASPSQMEHGYPGQLARVLDIQPVALGLGGTGFINPGPPGTNTPYKDRLSDLIASKPQVIVIATTGNDRGATSKVIEQAATAFVDAARKALPAARIILLGPIFIHDDPPNTDRIRTVTSDVAKAEHLAYIDPSGWITDASAAKWIGPDGAHPNDAGYQHIADLLAPALKPLLPAPTGG